MSREDPGLEQTLHAAFILGNRKLVVNYTALSAVAFPVDGMNS